MQEAAGGGSEQFIVTVKDNKSDKTPAEIAEAANAGKQVVLKETIDGIAQFYYLVNANNNVATFCGTEQIMDGPVDSNSILVRVWNFILNDKTIIYEGSFNIAGFIIGKDANGKYTSDLTPKLLYAAEESGNATNVLLEKDDETFIGTICVNAEQDLHIYFPDYAKDKVYDLKWNGDESPSTYTFTELSLSAGGGLLTVNITKDSSTNEFVADKTYAEIVAAIESGKKVQCDSDFALGYSSSYYAYNKGISVTFITHVVIGDYASIKDNFMSIVIAVDITSKDEITVATASLPMPAGLPLVSESNKILKTNADGAMKYVSADTYLVKQPTNDEKRKFLSTDGNGNQVWEGPLTAGNNDSIIIKSVTPNSTKKFRITVDDAGAITATEVV